MQQAHRPRHLQPHSQPTAIDAHCQRPQPRPGQAASSVPCRSTLGNVPKKCWLRHHHRAGSPWHRTSPPQGCKSKRPSERVRLSRTSLSGSHGCGWDHCRSQPRGAAACHRLLLRSPAPTAPGQHHGIKGRRDQSPRGLPCSCNEFVGALLSLAVPWERGKPSLAPWHSCRGTLSKPSATNGKRLLSKTPQITHFSHGSPASPKGNLKTREAGWVVFGAIPCSSAGLS